MELHERLTALGDIALLIGEYFQANAGMIHPSDSWNMAGFAPEHFESDFGWIFEELSKPTIEQLEAIKAEME